MSATIVSRIRRKLQKALHDFTGSNIARRANISPTATMAIRPSGIVQLAASTIYSKPTSTIPTMITGLPIRVVGTGLDYAGNTFGQMILEYLPLLVLIFLHLFLSVLIIWSGFVYTSILKGFGTCRSRICSYVLRSYLQFQMTMVTNSYAPIAQGNKLGFRLAWGYRPHNNITKTILYVLDLFDQLHSCIVVYEKHVQDLDDAMKQSAYALSKKDLQITNLQVAHAKEIAVLETKSTQDLADKDAEIANMKVVHDQETRDLANKSAQDLADKDAKIANMKVSHDQEIRDLAIKSTQDLANKDAEQANIKVIHDQEIRDLETKSIQDLTDKDAEVADIKHIREQEVKELKIAHVEEIGGLVTKSAQDLAKKDAEVADIKLAHEQEIKELKVAHVEEIGGLVTKSAQDLAKKDAEVADIKLAHEQEIKELKVAHGEEIRGLETKSAQDLTKKDSEVADIKLAHEQETRDLTNVWASRLASKEAEIENINATHDPRSSITEDDAALAPATDDFDPNDSDTSHPNNIKDHTADDPDESSEVLPSGKPNGKVSQKKKRRRRKRALKPEDGEDKPDAADGDIEQGSDHEPDTEQTVRAGKEPAGSAARPPIDRSQNSAAGSPAPSTASNGSARIPDNAPVGPSQFRAGPHIFNALPPPANAPTGPRGHAPREAPRGPRAEFNQRGGYRGGGEGDRGFGGFGRGRGRGFPYQGGHAGW